MNKKEIAQQFTRQMLEQTSFITDLGPGTENFPSQSQPIKKNTRTTQQKNFKDVNSFSERSRNLDLVSLLDGQPLGNPVHADHQHDPDIEMVLRLKQRKKRKKNLRR